jgi:pimeloyl-ACP methyl ester carboxylesterase
MQPQEITINIPSGTIAALEWGNKDNHPVIATHGWLDNAASFIPLAPLLNKLHIIAVDLPGHGSSQHRPPGMYFHFVDYIADIIAIANKLKWDNFSLLGHSLGAAILTLIAGTIPERINKLVLIDALGPFSVSANRMPELIKIAVNQYAKQAHKNMPQYNTKQEAITARLKATPMEKKSVEHLVERGLQKKGDFFYWRTDPRLLFKPLIMFTESQVEAFLKNITTPTCLIRPDQGWPFEESLFISRTQQISNLEIHRLPGKHHVHMDDPKPIAKIITDFFHENI